MKGRRGERKKGRTKPYLVQAPQYVMPRVFWIVGRRDWAAIDCGGRTVSARAVARRRKKGTCIFSEQGMSVLPFSDDESGVGLEEWVQRHEDGAVLLFGDRLEEIHPVGPVGKSE